MVELGYFNLAILSMEEKGENYLKPCPPPVKKTCN